MFKAIIQFCLFGNFDYIIIENNCQAFGGKIIYKDVTKKFKKIIEYYTENAL